MNTVGVAASNVGVYTYIRLYTYIMLRFTYTMYIGLCYACLILISAFVGPENQHYNYKMRSEKLHKTPYIFIHF